MSAKQGIVIPVYNHGKTAGSLVENLSRLGLPVIIVDDGSNEDTKSCLEKIYSSCSLTVPVRLNKNSGKGRAVYEGIKKAAELGLSHVLQIDADGQHDISRAGFFLGESAARPDALICSYPVYDDSVPGSREKGRVVANTWAKIVTLSNDIKESMLGFRVYPVEPVLSICNRHYIDFRMGFDIEILVRLHWKNIPFIFYPVGVSYPCDGISHFKPVLDNVRISWVFTRLCCAMIPKIPALLIRRWKKDRS
ncbi:MAG: glycosyltransferase family 2 protein [Treponema sp.]|nr:glycosyltransferase family 2 protein [Treponema sp.]